MGLEHRAQSPTTFPEKPTSVVLAEGISDDNATKAVRSVLAHKAGLTQTVWPPERLEPIERHLADVLRAVEDEAGGRLNSVATLVDDYQDPDQPSSKPESVLHVILSGVPIARIHTPEGAYDSTIPKHTATIMTRNAFLLALECRQRGVTTVDELQRLKVKTGLFSREGRKDLTILRGRRKKSS